MSPSHSLLQSTEGTKHIQRSRNTLSKLCSLNFIVLHPVFTDNWFIRQFKIFSSKGPRKELCRWINSTHIVIHLWIRNGLATKKLRHSLRFSIYHLCSTVSTALAPAWQRLSNPEPARRKLTPSSALWPDEACSSGVNCLDSKTSSNTH